VTGLMSSSQGREQASKGKAATVWRRRGSRVDTRLLRVGRGRDDSLSFAVKPPAGPCTVDVLMSDGQEGRADQVHYKATE